MPSLPSRLFHMTAPGNAESIRAEGLLGTPYVFASEFIDHCQTFVGWRLRARFGDTIEQVLADAPESFRTEVAAGEVYGARINENGEVVISVPQIERNDHAVIFEIDTSRLDPDKLHVSDDHATFVFGEGITSWAYLGDVPVEALVGEQVVSLD